MPLECGHFPAQLDRPQFDRMILAGRGELLAVWRERDRPDPLCVRPDRFDLTPRGDVPELHITVPPPRRQCLPVGRERDRSGLILMALDLGQLAPGARVPEPDGAVVTARRQYGAVLREVHRSDRLRVTFYSLEFPP